MMMNYYYCFFIILIFTVISKIRKMHINQSIYSSFIVYQFSSKIIFTEYINVKILFIKLIMMQIVINTPYKRPRFFFFFFLKNNNKQILKIINFLIILKTIQNKTKQPPNFFNKRNGISLIFIGSYFL
jgi:hypothetical protein